MLEGSSNEKNLRSSRGSENKACRCAAFNILLGDIPETLNTDLPPQPGESSGFYGTFMVAIRQLIFTTALALTSCAGMSYGPGGRAFPVPISTGRRHCPWKWTARGRGGQGVMGYQRAGAVIGQYCLLTGPITHTRVLYTTTVTLNTLFQTESAKKPKTSSKVWNIFRKYLKKFF